jgi:hypothetical protein
MVELLAALLKKYCEEDRQNNQREKNNVGDGCNTAGGHIRFLAKKVEKPGSSVTCFRV